MTPRAELIEIQKRLVKKIKQEMYADYCRENPEIEEYYEAYKKDTNSFERTASKAELLQQIIQSDIVYLGDFHTFHQSQKTLLRLLASLCKESLFLSKPRSIILGLEIVRYKDQEFLERYLRNDLDEKSFLRAINYEATWGFPWSSYQTIINYARKNSIKVVGLNSEYPDQANSIAKRDRYAAEVIGQLVKSHPGALLFILFGDLHLAETHLPQQVNEVLPTEEHLHKKTLIIYQNSERIYWELAHQRREQEIDVVKIKDNVYCVINSTPVFVFQSYLNWQNSEEEIASSPIHKNWYTSHPVPEQTMCGAPEVSDIDLTSQVIEIVKSICQFLELETPPFAKLSVYTPHNFDLLKRLGKDVLTPQEIKEIEINILKTESYFIDQTNMVYLATLSLNHVAEEAAHFIHNHYAPKPCFNPDFVQLDKFYYHIIREALGFLGSKIINHKRMCLKERDFEDILVETFAETITDPKKKEQQRVAKFILHHKHQEKNHLLTKYWKPIRGIYYLDTNLWISICQALGYILGDRIYAALVQEIIAKSEVRELFLNSFTEKRESFRSYLDLIRRVEPVRDLYPRMTDHL